MRRKSIISQFLAFLGALLIASQVNAQTITLGNDDESVFRVLRSGGYTNPSITKRGLTIIRTEACKGTDKYQVKVSILGRITSARKIGTCNGVRVEGFSPDDAIAALREAGFRQIEVQREGNRILAKACNDNRRFSFTFNQNGDVLRREPLGRCGPREMSEEDIAVLLRDNGYKRIVVTDSTPPRYVAEACRGDEKIRIQINRRGKIRSERRIGACGRQLDRRKIADTLERAGYEKVEVIDRRRPPYLARACKGSDKVEVSIGRYGRIFDQKKIGSCRRPINPNSIATLLEKDGYDRIKPLRVNRPPYLVEACRSRTLYELAMNQFGGIQRKDVVGTCSEPVTRKSLLTKLRSEGYINVKIRENKSGWRGEACREDLLVEINIDQFGDIANRRQIGKCQSSSVLNMVQTLEKRGATKTKVVIEGCYAGKKYHWVFDRLGNRVGRKPIGVCK